MKPFVVYLFVCLVWSCNSSENTERKVSIIDGTKTYDVYTASEMSTLMKGMYAYNEQLKHDIESGNQISVAFPEAFLKIHTAQLSETKLRNETFEHFSGKYIQAQQLIFEEDSLVSLEERYNNSIHMCLSCHKTECTGPIPKIKKLLIR